MRERGKFDIHCSFSFLSLSLSLSLSLFLDSTNGKEDEDALALWIIQKEERGKRENEIIIKPCILLTLFLSREEKHFFLLASDSLR